METFLGFIILIVLTAAIFNIFLIIMKGIGLLGAIAKYRVAREKAILKKHDPLDGQPGARGHHHRETPKQGK